MRRYIVPMLAIGLYVGLQIVIVQEAAGVCNSQEFPSGSCQLTTVPPICPSGGSDCDVVSRTGIQYSGKPYDGTQFGDRRFIGTEEKNCTRISLCLARPWADYVCASGTCTISVTDACPQYELDVQPWAIVLDMNWEDCGEG